MWISQSSVDVGDTCPPDTAWLPSKDWSCATQSSHKSIFLNMSWAGLASNCTILVGALESPLIIYFMSTQVCSSQEFQTLHL